MATLEELQKQKEEIEAKIKDALAKERETDIATIKALIKKHGLTQKMVARWGKKSRSYTRKNENDSDKERQDDLTEFFDADDADDSTTE